MVERETLFNQPINGLSTDTSPHLQPKGSYRFALNAVPETKNGDLGNIATEQSNETCIELASDEIIIGSVFVGNEESVVFVYDEGDTTSRIYIFNHSTCTKTQFLSLDCLNFNVAYPIQATFRVRNGCERWVYFVDGLNSDKCINLDVQSAYTDCKLIEQKLYGNEPCITLENIYQNGGTIPAGTIQVTCRYLDSEENPTEFFVATPPIPVHDSDNSWFPVVKGDKSVTTTKSFKFTFDNLDTTYNKLNIAVVETVDGISTAYNVETISFAGSSVDWTYYGTNRTETAFSSLQELAQKFSDLTVSKTITQKENHLVKGNLKSKQYDWWSFQGAAMDIESMYVVNKIRSNTVNSSANNPFYYMDKRSYMRDEVYAFGIVWVMKDGTESPVFHIPGRREYSTSVLGHQTVVDPNVITTGNANNHPLRNQAAGNTWDKEMLQVVETPAANNEVALKDVRHLEQFFVNCDSCAALTVNLKLDLTYDTTSNLNLQVSAVTPAIGYSTVKIYYDEIAPLTTNSVLVATITSPASSIPVTGVTINDGPSNLQAFVRGKIRIIITDAGGCEYQFIMSFEIDHYEKTIYIREITGPEPTIDYIMSGGKTSVGISVTPSNYELIKKSGCEIERWRVYNTAIQNYPVALQNVYSNGLMGYHESTTEVYPSILDCDGNSAFGTDSGSPVRHHRFPDSTLEPHYSTEFGESTEFQTFDDVTTYIYPVGAYFSNIEPPAKYVNDVLYYRIVRVERTEENESVIDKGILNYYRREADGSGNCRTTILPNYEGMTNDYTTVSKSIDISEVITPKPLFTKQALNPDHIKLERLPHLTRKDTRLTKDYPQPVGPSTNYHHELNIQLLDSDFSNANILNTNFTNNELWYNRKVTKEFLVYYNNQFRNSTYKVGCDIPGYHQISYWNQLEDEIGTTNIAKAYSYATINYVKHAQYISVKRLIPDQYYKLESQVYISCQNCPVYYDDNVASTKYVTVYGGDTFIGRMEYLQTFYMNGQISAYAVDTSATNFACTASPANDTSYITRIGFITESKINPELRHIENNQYFYPLVETLGIDFMDSQESTLGYHLTSGSFGGWKELYYTYNTDYSLENKIKFFFPNKDTDSFCSDCDNKFPNRVIWSLPSNPEDISDNYRQFLVNNAIDIPGNKGTITNLFIDGDYLVADCKRTRWVIPTTQQQLQTDATNLFIGTGDFMSIAPREVSNAETGFVGSQSQWCYAQSEYGILSVDQEDGRVFLSSNAKPKLISQVGLRNFFEENLPSSFLEQFKTLVGKPANLSGEYPFRDNPYNPYGGIGCFSTYDTRYERYILSKRDFVLTPDGLLAFNKTDGTPGVDKGILYDSYGFYWYYVGTPNDKTYLVPEENPLWFENKSFTVSYSVKNESWTSFHSYLPHYYIQSRFNFLSGKNTLTDVYKHNSGSTFRTYYDTVYDFIIEQVLTTQSEPTLFTNLSYQGYAEEYDSTYKEWLIRKDITFNKILLYNSYQCSGELSLEKTQNTFSDNIKNVSNRALYTYRENYYHVNQFKDLRTNSSLPMFRRDWTATQSSYFIDKVVNTLAVNSNKSWYQKQDFRDRYLAVRLILSNFESYKLVFNYLFGKNHITNG